MIPSAETVAEAAPPTPEPLPAPRTGSLRPRLTQALDGVGTLLPAILVVSFSFEAGGFFPTASGRVAFVLAIVLALRVTLADRPFAALGRAVGLAAAALLAFAAWTLASTAWSHAPGRALVEFDRTLLYLLAFLVAATLPWSPARVAWALRALVLAVFVVCLAALASRTAPDLFPTATGVASDRLSFPLTYWNAQGLLAALGFVLAFGVASSLREPLWTRVATAATAPVMVSVLLLTFSRGALLAAVVGVFSLLVLNRSRGLAAGILTVGPVSSVALLLTYDADLLATERSTSAAGVAQGHDLALGIALCVGGAVVLAIAVERWVVPLLRRATLSPRARRPVRLAVLVGVLGVVVAAPLALGAPAYVGRQYDRFVEGDTTPATDQRVRLLDPGNNGRLDHWKVALDAWRSERLHGTGAGTYQTQWNRRRELDLNVTDAHSLYLEVLSELGVVGFALLLGSLLTIALATALRTTRRGAPAGTDRTTMAVVGALFVTWGVHAGLDWIWEVPAVTAWLFALGGLALAVPATAEGRTWPGRSTRVAIGLGLLVVAVIPFQVSRSQGRLDDAVRTFQTQPRDCPKAIDASLASLAAVGARPEPWEIIAYCDVGENQLALAVEAARNAVARDPQKWTYQYALALVQGVAGEDPRPAARRALALNPRNPLANIAVERYGSAKRSRWPAIARTLRLPND